MKHTMTHPKSQIGFSSKTNPLLRFYRNILKAFEKDQGGYTTVAIITQNYVGSLAILFLTMNQMIIFPKIILLTLVFLCCLSFNVAVIRKFKPKVIFNLLVISLSLSVTILIILLA